MEYTPETFFRPDVVTREQTSIRAQVFNQSRLALNHSNTDCAFVPVRSMQFQAVITHDEIIFVDNQAYRVQDGQGGRLIVLAWNLTGAEHRESLTDPVAIEVLHFHSGLKEVQRRLMGEFPTALSRHEEIEHSHEDRSQDATVIPLLKE